MQKTKLLMISSVIALYLGGACISVAAELDENMQELAKNINILKSSTEKDELMKALDMMSKAVDGSMNIIPEKISPDDKLALDEYRNG
ncbi:TPA: cytochrome b562 family protein, partial [Raoultella planticola]|nr:cytochrome b562 family protein [Raoultella planticola]